MVFILFYSKLPNDDGRFKSCKWWLKTEIIVRVQSYVDKFFCILAVVLRFFRKFTENDGKYYVVSNKIIGIIILSAQAY